MAKTIEQQAEEYAEKQQVASSGNMFKNAKFGVFFLTRDGRKAIYWASPEITGTGKHALIVEETANGNYITCDDSGSCLGKFNIEHQSDIVTECENTDQEKEQLRDELDALHMRYLSQVSLWKSNYEELKKKLSEPVNEDKLNRLAEELYPDFRFRDVSMSNKSHREALKVGYRKAWEDKI